MQLNFLQEDLLSALQDSKPATKSQPKQSQKPDLFGGLPLAAPVAAAKKPELAPAPAPLVVETAPEEEKHHPEKAPGAMKTISEAAEILGVQQHVLRFWESRFSQIKPLKLRGGRRYYRPEDMEILSKIQHLLYKQGYTIKGAKQAISEDKPAKNKIILTTKQRKQVSAIRHELMGLREVLRPYLETSFAAH